jgi:hypothetical protein
MDKYTCIKCNKKFNRKANYIRHLNRKFSCSDGSYSDSKIDKSNLLKTDIKTSIKKNELFINYSQKKMNIFPKKKMNFLKKKKKIIFFSDDNSEEIENTEKNNEEDNYISYNNQKDKFNNSKNDNIKQFKPNNIYSFNISTFGKKIYGKGGGDIYIIQTDNDFNNIYKIGKSVNLYNKLKDYRCMSDIEPRLFYYYPFKNIKKAINDLKDLLGNYNLNKDIFKCDLKIIRSIILNYQKQEDDEQIENEPFIKDPTLYKCVICDKEFETKEKIFDHLNTCDFYRNEFLGIAELKSYKCNECHKEFNHKNSYYRHKKHYCNENQEDNTLKSESEEIKSLKEELKLMKKEMEELRKSKSNIYNDNKTVNNNITVIAYNKPQDLSHLTDNDFLKIMNKGFKSVPKLIEAIHFNPDKPENQNVYIPNLKNNYVMVWNGKKWVLTPRKDVIDDMYEDKSNMLFEKMEELKDDSIKPHVIKKFKRFMNNKESDNIKNKIKDEIKLILYNNKDKIYLNTI